MSNWTKWNGGECPVEKGVLVDVRYRDGEGRFSIPALIDVTGNDASYAYWNNDNASNDIVAYRLSEKAAEKSPLQPDSDGWYEHDGVEIPCASDEIVDIMLHVPEGETEEENTELNTEAGEWFWEWETGEPTIGCIVKWRYAKEHAHQEAVQETTGVSPVKSDGGSSGYYKITIKNENGEEFHCETNDVLYALVGGDFDMANIIKACRRMYEASQGRGKQGTDIAYDVKKIKYFADDFAKRFGNA